MEDVPAGGGAAVAENGAGPSGSGGGRRAAADGAAAGGAAPVRRIIPRGYRLALYVANKDFIGAAAAKFPVRRRWRSKGLHSALSPAAAQHSPRLSLWVGQTYLTPPRRTSSRSRTSRRGPAGSPAPATGLATRGPPCASRPRGLGVPWSACCESCKKWMPGWTY